MAFDITKVPWYLYNQTQTNLTYSDNRIFYGNLTNTLRGSLSVLAVFFNLYVIYLFIAHKTLRTSRINWAVCNLMFSNVLMCTALMVYSFIKLNDYKSPSSTTLCLVLNWVMVSVSFGPSWSITLMTSLRALSYSNNSKKWEEYITLGRLIAIRIALTILDICMASLIIFDVANLASKTRCAYQIMLDKSLFYVLYNLVVGCLLLIGGLSSLIMRMRLRGKILASLKHQPTHRMVEEGHRNAAHALAATAAPSLLWKKPKLIIFFIILATLFILPRVAFLTPENLTFWQTATLCPPIIALIFAWAFLTIPKDFRKVSKNTFVILFRRIFACNKRPDVTSPNQTESQDRHQIVTCSSTTSSKN